MTELPIIYIDDRGRFHRNIECLYVPQPKDGTAQCILCTKDGYHSSFDSEASLRAAVMYARSLPGATFDPKLVIEFALDTPSDGGPDPTAWRLSGQTKFATGFHISPRGTDRTANTNSSRT
jgi:hypothetical protein